MNYKKLHEETLAALQKMVFDGKITEETARSICSDFIKESEDEKVRKELIGFVKSRGGFKQEYIAWLEKQGKKTEPIEGFNTEFERQISHLIASVLNGEHEYNEGFVKYASQSMLGFAKKEQNLAGWSEEDERLLSKLQTYVDMECFDRECNGEDLINWLKSFKPQPHWKPSKEQMAYLKKVYESYYACEGERSALESLYNDLKKL